MAWASLAGDTVDLIPFVTAVGETVKVFKAANKVVDAADAAHDVAKTTDNIVDSAKAAKKGWNVGDDITTLTKAGNEPTWSTVRSRYWKNEEFYNGSGYNDIDRLRMKQGKPPLVKYPENGKFYPMELHHKKPRRDGGSNAFDNLEPLSPWDHDAKDPFRHFRP